MAGHVTIEEKYSNPSLNLAIDTIRIRKQALVFANTKMSAERTAEDIAQKTGINSAELNELADKVLKVLSKPTRQCERLARCIRKGTAFHHAGLTQKQKELVEDSFRAGKIRIIACTPSLAMGVDLPAFRSIIRDLRRYTRHGLRYIPVLEYLQMAGRAGRPSFDSFGEAIIIAASEADKEKLYRNYVLGEPEEIYSKLAVEPVLRTYLLSLIATGFVRSKKQILDFFSQTFWAHQRASMDELEIIIDKMLGLLEEFEFIKSSMDEFTSADKLDDLSYRATTLGRRVAELYLDPLTAHNFLVSIRRATKIHILPVSFLHMVSYTPELRPLLRVKMKEYDHIQEELAKYGEHLVVNEPSAFEPEYDEFLNSVKTALFFSDWIDEKDEEQMLEKFSIRPGEIRAKIEIADWLLYSAAELARLQHFRKIVSEIAKLRLRLRYGVREELLPLLKLRSIGRVRARALYRNGIKDIGDVKKAPVATIAALIKSRKIAQDIKEQLGQKVEKTSRRKRKGQKGLV